MSSVTTDFYSGVKFTVFLKKEFLLRCFYLSECQNFVTNLFNVFLLGFLSAQLYLS